MKTLEAKGKYGTVISVKVLDKIELPTVVSKKPTEFPKPDYKAINGKKSSKYQLLVKSRGDKGSWWNRYVDNFFIGESLDGGKTFRIFYLCDKDRVKVKAEGFERQTINASFVSARLLK